MNLLLDSRVLQRIPARHTGQTHLLLDTQFLHYQPPRYKQALRILLEQRILHKDSKYGGRGYFAGTLDGIVTVAGAPAARRIHVLDTADLRIVRSVWSQDNGQYFVSHLDPSRRYLLIARDSAYEPVAWDSLRPATSLNILAQEQLLRERGYIRDNWHE